MELQFHGAVRTVTGSQHIVRANGLTILLDCGFYQGKRRETIERNTSLPYDPKAIDVMVLSHAHIDHSGNIPNLVKKGFRGDIICTYATRDLCTLMLRDSAKIQQYDVQYLNKKLARQHQPLLEPIYNEADTVEAMKYFVGIGYDRPFRLGNGVWLTLYDAGHILGSAIVALDVEPRKEEGKPRRLVFSGDVGRPNRPILRDPTRPKEADILIMESTYGDREHQEDAVCNDMLRDVVNRTCKRGGRLIVPAFAVGRTQELVYRLHQLVEKGEIPIELPIYVDSPLAIDATSVYRLHPEAYDQDLIDFMAGDRHSDPFGFDMMRYTRTTAESKELNELDTPAVIISASGMAENGRILHHLMHNIEDPRNTILIVGWMAPDTLGRRILERQPRVRIFGDWYELRAEVVSISGFSAHADRSELLDWLGDLKRRPAHTFIVHGDEDVSLSFAETLRKKKDFRQVTVPHLGQSFTV